MLIATLNKDLVNNDMVVEGTDGNGVAACGDAERQGAAGLPAQHVEFPLLRAERLLQAEYGGFGIVNGNTEAQVATIEGVGGNECHGNGTVGIAR